MCIYNIYIYIYTDRRTDRPKMLIHLVFTWFSPANICACHEKWLDCFIVLAYETSFTVRGATGVTIQPHQILRLSRRKTRILAFLLLFMLSCYNHAECGFVSIFHLVATTGKVSMLDPFARSISIIAPKIALILLGRVLLLSPSVSLFILWFEQLKNRVAITAPPISGHFQSSRRTSKPRFLSCCSSSGIRHFDALWSAIYLFLRHLGATSVVAVDVWFGIFD